MNAPCPRCGGFIVCDTEFDDVYVIWRWYAKCVNCGYYTDKVRSVNRQLKATIDEALKFTERKFRRVKTPNTREIPKHM